MVAEDGRLKLAFGEAVRQRRVELGYSQEKLAEHAGIHRTYIGDVERGLRNVALVNMTRIAMALQTRLSALLIAVERKGGQCDG